MFAEVEFEWTVVVQPNAMKSGAHIQRAVILALLKDFNDVKCTAQHGYHVVLTTLDNIGEGRLWERRGCAAFPVRFRCLVFNVVKNEHVLAVVTEAQSSGLLCNCGPMEQLFVSKKHMTKYEFLSTEVDSLPVTKWQNTRNGTTIQKGDVIRVRILATKWEAAQRSLSAAGSLLGDYAGVDDRWPELNIQKRADSGGWGGSPTRNEVDGSGWEEPNGTADNSGWGEPLPNDNSGWGGEPITNGAADNSEWGEPLPKGSADDSGWGEPLPKDDEIGASGWD